MAWQQIQWRKQQQQRQYIWWRFKCSLSFHLIETSDFKTFFSFIYILCLYSDRGCGFFSSVKIYTEFKYKWNAWWQVNGTIVSCLKKNCSVLNLTNAWIKFSFSFSLLFSFAFFLRNEKKETTRNRTGF